MSEFSEKIMAIIRKAVDDQFNGNISAASKACGVTGDNLNKWLSGKRVPSIVLDKRQNYC